VDQDRLSIAALLCSIPSLQQIAVAPRKPQQAAPAGTFPDSDEPSAASHLRQCVITGQISRTTSIPVLPAATPPVRDFAANDILVGDYDRTLRCFINGSTATV
jgi:hypothetical protein